MYIPPLVDLLFLMVPSTMAEQGGKGESLEAEVGDSKERRRCKGCQLNRLTFPVGSVSAEPVVLLIR